MNENKSYDFFVPRKEGLGPMERAGTNILDAREKVLHEIFGIARKEEDSPAKCEEDEDDEEEEKDPNPFDEFHRLLDESRKKPEELKLRSSKWEER